jgi:hypothetical protein
MPYPPDSRLQRVIKRIRRVGSLSVSDQLLTGEVYRQLAMARFALMIFPFRRVAGTLGQTLPSQVSYTEPPHTLSESQREIIRKLAWIFPRVARGAFFTATCLPQAIAARRMLQTRGIPSVLHFGVVKLRDANTMEAHAWLESQGIDVTGGSIATEFTEIAKIV